MAECEACADGGEGCGCWVDVSIEDVEGKMWVDLPAGRTTLERSHSPSVFLNSSKTTLGRSSLGMSCAIELTVCVGAANRVAGARARMREIVFVKIIVGVGMVCGKVRRDGMLCDDRQWSRYYIVSKVGLLGSIVVCQMSNPRIVSIVRNSSSVGKKRSGNKSQRYQREPKSRET